MPTVPICTVLAQTLQYVSRRPPGFSTRRRIHGRRCGMKMLVTASWLSSGEITDFVAATGFDRQYPTRCHHCCGPAPNRTACADDTDAHAGRLDLPSRLI